MYDTFTKIITESRLVLGQMAPYLLFGFAVAGANSCEERAMPLFTFDREPKWKEK